MNIFRLAFEIFLVYLAYRFIFGFIIPVYRTTRQMKRKMAEMHEKMNEQSRQPDSAFPRKETVTSAKSYADEYIDYEEVK